jgi:hypothetical protein
MSHEYIMVMKSTFITPQVNHRSMHPNILTDKMHDKLVVNICGRRNQVKAQCSAHLIWSTQKIQLAMEFILGHIQNILQQCCLISYKMILLLNILFSAKNLLNLLNSKRCSNDWHFILSYLFRLSLT